MEVTMNIGLHICTNPFSSPSEDEHVIPSPYDTLEVWNLLDSTERGKWYLENNLFKQYSKELQKTEAILYATDEHKKKMIGCILLLRQRRSRKEELQRKTKYIFSPFYKWLELAYFTVVPEYQKMGIGSNLLELIDIYWRHEKFFATVMQDNKHVVNMLFDTGLVPVETFPSVVDTNNEVKLMVKGPYDY